MNRPPAGTRGAQELFGRLLGELRPKLHRYLCSHDRLMVLSGERHANIARNALDAHRALGAATIHVHPVSRHASALRDQGLCDSLNRPSRPRRCGRTLRTRWQFARRQCGVGGDPADIGGSRRVLLISSSVPLGFRLVLHVLNRFGRS